MVDNHKTSGGGYVEPERMAEIERALEDVKPRFSSHFNEDSAVELVLAAVAEVISERAQTQNS